MMPPGSRVSLAVVFCVTGDGIWSRGVVLFGPGPTHAFSGQFDSMSVVNEAVQDGVGVGGIADDLVPAVHGKLGGNERRTSPISFLKDFEKIMPGGGVERLQPPVVENEQIGAAEVA